jgi:hypothetical protein
MSIKNIKNTINIISDNNIIAFILVVKNINNNSWYIIITSVINMEEI